MGSSSSSSCYEKGPRMDASVGPGGRESPSSAPPRVLETLTWSIRQVSRRPPHQTFWQGGRPGLSPLTNPYNHPGSLEGLEDLPLAATSEAGVCRRTG